MMKYVMIVILFMSCAEIQREKNRVISKEPLDTVKTISTDIIAKPALFETAFIRGTTMRKGNSGPITLYGVNIGKLKIQSGRVVACDPTLMEEYGKPFTQVFPAGEFPVQLSIAKLGNNEEIGFARIMFSDQPVVRWELALLEGQEPLPVGGEKTHGYVVDGGVGAFLDNEAVKAINKNKSTQMNDKLFTEMDKHFHINWKYTLHDLGEYNIAVFTPGPGEGVFSTYIGFDAAGKPCRLVTDFGLFEWR